MLLPSEGGWVWLNTSGYIYHFSMVMCWCAVKKLLTHSLTHSLTQSQPSGCCRSQEAPHRSYSPYPFISVVATKATNCPSRWTENNIHAHSQHTSHTRPLSQMQKNQTNIGLELTKHAHSCTLTNAICKWLSQTIKTQLHYSNIKIL